ncbi:hypothetical protein KPL40_05380 [Clostridium gasigenes]|uniref:hypothetical protein n=1 Tax=Clostridium gasigenes TaxID=94869 RepID=UPI001C0CC70A|nr:hypothetical protein [Clostridium gasigenes]MBU3131877.1 hypothetical protein [Clostridium gasigenes]
MSKVVADYVNDPDNDFDLMVEILDDNEEIAMIRKVEGIYKLIIFENIKRVEIPLEWLNNVIRKL